MLPVQLCSIVMFFILIFPETPAIRAREGVGGATAWPTLETSRTCVCVCGWVLGTNERMHVCMYVYAYMSACLCMYVCMCVCVCVRARARESERECVFVCVYRVFQAKKRGGYLWRWSGWRRRLSPQSRAQSCSCPKQVSGNIQALGTQGYRVNTLATGLGKERKGRKERGW